MNSITCETSTRAFSGWSPWILLLVLVFAGCFSPPTAKDLEIRARQYMQERQKRDWVAVYDEFLDPELRPLIPRERFLRKRNGAYDLLSFAVDSVQIEAEESPRRGRVQVRMEAVIPLMTPTGGSQTIRRELVDPQQWVVRDGEWFVLLKR